jgi:hypothetical protein
VDINVMAGTTPVVNRYGTLGSTAAPAVVKVDHCEFRAIPVANTQCRKLPASGTRDAAVCIADCIAVGAHKCNSVQVSRYVNAPRTLPRPVNIPFVYQFNDGASTVRDQPCNKGSVMERVTAGCTIVASNPTAGQLLPSPKCDETAMALAPTDLVCFSLVPGPDLDAQVEESYVIATEPEDPVWYSVSRGRREGRRVTAR